MTRQLSTLGYTLEMHAACQLLKVHDHQAFVSRAVQRLSNETAALCSEKISTSLASKMAEFIVWHTMIDGLEAFEERHAHNTQNYDWLSPTSRPDVDICGVALTDEGWKFLIVEVKWSEKCAYTQITSSGQGLVGDINKMFTGTPTSRMSTLISSLRCNLRKHASCRDAYIGMSEIIIGLDPRTTRNVQFYGFFVGDIQLAQKKEEFDRHFQKFKDVAIQSGWSSGDVKGYFITATPLFDVLDAVARGRV